LKYIVRRQPETPGKVTLNLHAMSGALNETENQNGKIYILKLECKCSKKQPARFLKDANTGLIQQIVCSSGTTLARKTPAE
jgi:hypothetical protein